MDAGTITPSLKRMEAAKLVIVKARPTTSAIQASVVAYEYRMKRPATQWVKPGVVGREKPLRGEEDLRHASPRDFREEE